MPSTKIKGNEEARNTRKDIIPSKELCKTGDLEDSDEKIPSNNDLRSEVEQQKILFKCSEVTPALRTVAAAGTEESEGLLPHPSKRRGDAYK